MTIEIKGVGKVTATKDALCELAFIASCATEYNKMKGYNATAQRQNDVFNAIYDALKAVGYYDDVANRN